MYFTVILKYSLSTTNITTLVNLLLNILWTIHNIPNYFIRIYLKYTKRFDRLVVLNDDTPLKTLRLFMCKIYFYTFRVKNEIRLYACTLK